MAYKKISELCMALPLVNSDLFLVSQTDVNSTNKISRQLPVSQLWSEISARFVTYDYDGAEKAALSSDRHHSFAYALSSDVSSKTQVEDRFNTLSVYKEIHDQLSNDDYVTGLCVYTRISADMRFALSANVYTSEYISSHYALSSDVYKQTEVFNRIESDKNYYRKTDVYTKTESDKNYYRKTDVYTKTESDKNYYRKTDVYRKDETYSQEQADYKFTLRPATKTSLGGLKIGDGLTVASDGTVSTVSNITLQGLLDKIYPIGCIYLTLDGRNPAQIFGFGLWQRIALGRCLWGANSDSSDLGELREPGLPDITGSFAADDTMIGAVSAGGSKPPNGAFTGSYSGNLDLFSNGSGSKGGRLNFAASSSNKIYGRSKTVQPPALVVNMWKRVATLGPAERPAETAYSYDAKAKSGSWIAPNELEDLTISITLPGDCSGSGGQFYIGGELVASVSKGKTTTVTGKSAAKGQTFAFASGCRNHSLTVRVSGKQIITTKNDWS